VTIKRPGKLTVTVELKEFVIPNTKRRVRSGFSRIILSVVTMPVA